MVNYSFIIPHYNASDMLTRCINSIPQRNDIEIIVIDDNSIDENKPSIIRNDVSVIFLSKEQSSGAGHARNVGIDNSHGKWLVFVDCDDFLAEGALDILDKYLDADADMVYFKINSVDSNTLSPIERCIVFNKYIDNFCSHKLMSEGTLKYIQCVPWGKIIKKDLISRYNIRFEEIKYGNDVIFSLNCGLHSTKILASKDILYTVTHREGSLVTQVSFDSVYCRYKVVIRRALLLISAHKLFYLGSLLPETRKIIEIGEKSSIDAFYYYAKSNGLNIVSLYLYSAIGTFGSFIRYFFGKL